MALENRRRSNSLEKVWNDYFEYRAVKDENSVSQQGPKAAYDREILESKICEFRDSHRFKGSARVLARSVALLCKLGGQTDSSPIGMTVTGQVARSQSLFGIYT